MIANEAIGRAIFLFSNNKAVVEVFLNYGFIGSVEVGFGDAHVGLIAVLDSHDFQVVIAVDMRGDLLVGIRYVRSKQGLFLVH